MSAPVEWSRAWRSIARVVQVHVRRRIAGRAGVHVPTGPRSIEQGVRMTLFGWMRIACGRTTHVGTRLMYASRRVGGTSTTHHIQGIDGMWCLRWRLRRCSGLAVRLLQLLHGISCSDSHPVHLRRWLDAPLAASVSGNRAGCAVDFHPRGPEGRAEVRWLGCHSISLHQACPRRYASLAKSSAGMSGIRTTCEKVRKT